MGTGGGGGAGSYWANTAPPWHDNDFNTDGNLIEYICKVSFEHMIFTDPVPVLKAA